jgi:ELWxxDGT repeat protein
MTSKKLLASMLLFSFNSFALEQQSSGEFSFPQASKENIASLNTLNTSTSQYSELSNFHSDGENVLFTYNSEDGNELGTYTPSETRVLNHDINPGSGNSSPAGFMLFNGNLYFSAYNLSMGRELYYFDNATKTAVLVADINPNGDSLISPEANDGNLYSHKPYAAKSYKAFKNHLYFVANDGVNGQELWALDSNNTPEMVKDLFEGNSSSNPRYFNTTGEYLYFIVDAQNGDSLIRLHGDSQQAEVIATYPEISHLTTTVDDAFFVAKGEQGVEVLYQFETESNTVVAVTDPSTNLMNTFSNFDSLIAVNNSVYFNAKSPGLSEIYDPKVFWQFDLDTLAARRFGVDELSHAQVFGVFNNKLFFSQEDWSYYSTRLFLTDNKNAIDIKSYYLSMAQGGYAVNHVKQHGDEIYYSLKGPYGANLLAKINLLTNGVTEFFNIETPYYPSRETSEAFNSFALVNDTIYYPITIFSGDGELKHYFESYNMDTDELATISLVESLNPIANIDLISLNVNENIQIDVLANDTDPQGASLAIAAATATSGEVDIVNGMLHYTAKTNFVGSDVISYTIENEYGLSASAEVQVTVVAVAPIATADVTSLNANSDVQIDVFANDTDPQGASLTIIAAQTTSGSVEIVSGKLHYTAKANFVGSDVISYTIENEHGLSASAEVQVTVVEVAPNAVADIASLNANSDVQIDVLANDTDPQGASLTITAATAISGTVEIVEDKLVYTAKTDFFGTDVVTYNIENEFGLSASAEVQVTVVALAPNATADTASLNANSDVQIDVLVNDTDPQNALLTITAATATLGTVEIVDGKLHYTAKTDFVGSDVITYTIENEYGLSASAEVQVTVKAIEEPVTEKKKSSGSLYFILLMMCLLVLFNKGGRLTVHRR